MDGHAIEMLLTRMVNRQFSASPRDTTNILLTALVLDTSSRDGPSSTRPAFTSRSSYIFRRLRIQVVRTELLIVLLRHVPKAMCGPDMSSRHEDRRLVFRVRLLHKHDRLIRRDVVLATCQDSEAPHRQKLWSAVVRPMLDNTCMSKPGCRQPSAMSLRRGAKV